MAVKKKEKESAAGAPAWMVTYGDMVTLLLTFFVMLLAMSEVKKDDRYVDFMQAIREAFGYVGGMRQTPLDPTEVPTNVVLTDMLIIPTDAHDFAKSRDPGIKGEYTAVTSNRRPEVYTSGSKIEFAELSAELSDEQRADLAEFAESMRGYNTQIEVSGHCSRKPVAGTPFADHTDLSFARARAVTTALVDAGIDPRRIIITAAGTNEPVTIRAYTAREREQNDIVEILQIDKRVDGF